MRELDRNLSIAFIAIIFFALYSYLNVTGFATVTTPVQITIPEILHGQITTFLFKAKIAGNEVQNITIEFTNIGSAFINSTRIEVYVYIYQNNTLNITAEYFDSYVSLAPGMRRWYNTVYRPSVNGIFYIKARVPYDSRVEELWGVFTTFNIVSPVVGQPKPSEESGSGEGLGPGSGGGSGGGGTGGGAGGSAGGSAGAIAIGGTPVKKEPEPGIAKIDVKYPDKIDLYENQSTLVDIKVINTGEEALHRIKLYTSTASFFDLNVNPKQVAFMDVNASQLFLVSLNTTGVRPGQYSLGFEAVSDETRVRKSITINILPLSKEAIEDLNLTINNYRLLLGEIERNMLSASLSGFDMTSAKKSVEAARTSLNEARRYFDDNKYDKARDLLDRTRKGMEEAVFNIAHASLGLKAEPTFNVYLIVILPAISILLIIVYMRIKKKGLRPKILREVEGEE